MSKRTATNQIEPRTFNPDVIESDDEPSTMNATKEILARRKIIKPRGRFALSESNPAPLSVKPVIKDDKNEKIKALNDKVIDTLKNLNKPNEIVNFKPVFDKYNEYYSLIESGSAIGDVPDTSIGKPFGNGSVTNESNNISNNQSNSLFSFNKESGDKPKSGFSFGSTKSKDSADKPFSFGSNPVVETKEKEPTTFSFGNKPAEIEKPVESDKPAFSFSSKPVESDKPAFSFSSKPVESDKPAFSFGSKPVENSTESKNPAFSFGNKIAETEKPSESDKPAFSFNAKPVESEKPVFSFGSKPSDQSEKSTFSFSAKPTESDKPAFSFGSSKPAESDKPAFSFGSKPVGTEQPAFSFGAKPVEDTGKPAESEKPAFSFGAKPVESGNSEPKKPFSFGNNQSESGKPAFSFGSKPAETAKPAFSFGASVETESKSEDKPVFSFGKLAESKTDDKPVFSFGSKPAESDKPAFSFGNKPESDKPAFSFGNNKAFSQPQSNKEPEEEEKIEEEEVEGNFQPIASLGSVANDQTGEEDEIVQYTKRTKLMLFQPSNKDSPYLSKGVGELKILTNKETNKTRLLIRADGGLRVLLNAGIQSDFEYNLMGDGLVRFPVASEGKIDTYVLRVKTKTDGEELVNKINEFK